MNGEEFSEHSLIFVSLICPPLLCRSGYAKASKDIFLSGFAINNFSELFQPFPSLQPPLNRTFEFALSPLYQVPFSEASSIALESHLLRSYSSLPDWHVRLPAVQE